MENPHVNPEHEGPEDPRWLDRPGSVDKIIWALCIASAATVFADFFYHKHGHWSFQEWFGFDAAYGFVACVGLVLAAKGLRVVLMRDENYYGDQAAGDSEREARSIGEEVGHD